MTIDTTQSNQPDQTIFAIGAKLKSAREALGMDKKDVAAQLRLNENVISMLEKDSYPNELPTIFIRGYIRSYGKFLQLPEYDIKQALEPIQPPKKVEPELVTKPAVSLPKPSKQTVMKIVNAAIALTMLSLVWLWWHSHNTSSVNKLSEQNLQNLPIPFDMGAPNAAQTSAATPLENTPIHTGNPSASPSTQIPLAPQINNALSDAATKPVAINTSEPVSAPATPQKKVVAVNQAKNTDDDDDEYDDVE